MNYAETHEIDLNSLNVGPWLTRRDEEEAENSDDYKGWHLPFEFNITKAIFSQQRKHDRSSWIKKNECQNHNSPRKHIFYQRTNDIFNISPYLLLKELVQFAPSMMGNLDERMVGKDYQVLTLSLGTIFLTDSIFHGFHYRLHQKSVSITYESRMAYTFRYSKYHGGCDMRF